MQPDAGFIENIDNIAQACADLAGEPYPLRFTPGECRCRTRQREVT